MYDEQCDRCDYITTSEDDHIVTEGGEYLCLYCYKKYCEEKKENNCFICKWYADDVKVQAEQIDVKLTNEEVEQVFNTIKETYTAEIGLSNSAIQDYIRDFANKRITGIHLNCQKYDFSLKSLETSDY